MIQLPVSNLPPLVDAIVGGLFGLVPLGMALLIWKYYKGDHQHRKKGMASGVVVALILSPALANVQTYVLVDDNHVVIQRLIVGTISNPRDSVVEVGSVAGKSGSTLQIKTPPTLHAISLQI